jgi:hypothetical protein
VAAWFASNNRRESRALQQLREPFERVLLYRNIADYVPDNQEGHMYILAKDALKRLYRLYERICAQSER